jgi:predicted Zn-dependent peptidase
MDVIIKEIAGTVRFTESDPLTDPAQFERLVGAVLEAIEARQGRAERLAEQTRVTPGSTDWMQRGSAR